MRKVSVWVTSKEYAFLVDLAKNSNVSVSDFIRACVVDVLVDEGMPAAKRRSVDDMIVEMSMQGFKPGEISRALHVNINHVYYIRHRNRISDGHQQQENRARVGEARQAFGASAS
jgi:hypothetical protein